MNKVQDDLFELCFRFLQLLETFREKGIISDSEYEVLGRQKKLFIYQKNNKLSSWEFVVF